MVKAAKVVPAILVPALAKAQSALGVLAALAIWSFSSFYRVDTSEQSIELLFGKYYATGQEGLKLCAVAHSWTKEIIGTTRENVEDIGVWRTWQ